MLKFENSSSMRVCNRYDRKINEEEISNKN